VLNDARYMEWIPFSDGRLAPFGHMTSVDGKPIIPTAEPNMLQGTTAEISNGTAIEIKDASGPEWHAATVVAVNDDGESIMAEFVGGTGATPDWVAINSGRIRMRSQQEKTSGAAGNKPKKGVHRR